MLSGVWSIDWYANAVRSPPMNMASSALCIHFLILISE